MSLYMLTIYSGFLFSMAAAALYSSAELTKPLKYPGFTVCMTPQKNSRSGTFPLGRRSGKY